MASQQANNLGETARIRFSSVQNGETTQGLQLGAAHRNFGATSQPRGQLPGERTIIRQVKGRMFADGNEECNKPSPIVLTTIAKDRLSLAAVAQFLSDNFGRLAMSRDRTG